MKKSVFNTIAAYVTTHNVPELASVRDEILAEYNKNKAKEDARMSAYDKAHDVVMTVMGVTPMTIAEVYDACADELPEGFTKANVQYGILNYWKDELVKIANPKGANTYAVKA